MCQHEINDDAFITVYIVNHLVVVNVIGKTLVLELL